MAMNARAGQVDDELEAQIHREVAELVARKPKRSELSRQTAALLFFKFNIRPSVATVLHYTKRGSTTDINRDLDEFWASIRDACRVRLDGAGIPAEFTQEAGQLLANLWAGAKRHADAALEPLRQECREEVAAAKQVAEQALADAERAGARAEAADGLAREAEQLREAAERALAVSRADLQASREREATLQQQCVGLEAARRATEERFSADLAAQDVARQRGENQLEGELRFAKMQIEEARSVGRLAQEKVKEVERDRALVELQLRQQLNSERDRNGAMSLELGELRGESRAIAGERDRLATELAELRRRAGEETADQLEEARSAKHAALKAQLIALPHAYQVREALTNLFDCELILDESTGTLWLGLGETIQATPKFANMNALEQFCGQHVDRYTDISEIGEMPQKWFWDRPALN